MADERQDSIRQGIGVPPESEIGKAAAEEKRKRNAQGPEIGGGMGGTSDADSPGDEAQFNAQVGDQLSGGGNPRR